MGRRCPSEEVHVPLGSYGPVGGLTAKASTFLRQQGGDSLQAQKGHGEVMTFAEFYFWITYGAHPRNYPPNVHAVMVNGYPKLVVVQVRMEPSLRVAGKTRIEE